MADPTTEPGPDNRSSDYAAMADYWTMVDAILGGAETMRAAAQTYLPKFENEDQLQYDRRRKTAPFTNIYGDVSRNLSAKPFSRELTLKDGAPEQIETLAEDIDGQGNNLHVFAESAFQHGLDKAIDWILVDYTKTPAAEGTRPLSIAEERAIGARPYWVHISAERMLAAYSDRVNGQEVFVHARIAEPTVVRNGYGETTSNRVRVLNRDPRADGSYAAATYEVFEEQENEAKKKVWVSIEGPFAITIGQIPLVPFVTGKRLGSSWRVRPPLRDIAHLQVDAYQQESNLKLVLEMAGYPMLAANGVDLRDPVKPGEMVKVPVGPGAVLCAPPANDGKHGEWTFIEPNSQSITALENHLEATQRNMRDLGMQPLTQANLTVITTANVSIKAHSAVQAWALKLKDALEQALKFTAMWLGDASAAAEIDIFTDFGVDAEADTELDSLLTAQKQGVLSKRTVQDEFKRRGVLSDNFDPDEEDARLASDEQGLEPDEEIDPVTGQPIVPAKAA